MEVNQEQYCSIFDGLSKTQLAKFKEIKRKTYSLERPCILCGEGVEKAHNHLLQENGILSNISEDKHLYYHGYEAFDDDLCFKRKSQNQSFRANILCPKCDSEIFQHMENVFESKSGKRIDPDFTKPKTHYHLSLRPLFWEIRKQDILIDLNSELEESGYFPDLQNHFSENKELQKYRKKLLSAYLNTYFKDIKNETSFYQKLDFKYKNIPKIDIALTSSISVCLPDPNSGAIHAHVYGVHIIPLKDRSVVSILTDTEKWKSINKRKKFEVIEGIAQGTILDDFYRNFEKLSESEMLKNLNDILLYFAEDWVVSPSFYEKNIRQRENRIVDAIKPSYTNPYKFFQPIKNTINLFDPNT